MPAIVSSKKLKSFNNALFCKIFIQWFGVSFSDFNYSEQLKNGNRIIYDTIQVDFCLANKISHHLCQNLQILPWSVSQLPKLNWVEGKWDHWTQSLDLKIQIIISKWNTTEKQRIKMMVIMLSIQWWCPAFGDSMDWLSPYLPILH